MYFAGLVSRRNAQINAAPRAGPVAINRKPVKSPKCWTIVPIEAVPIAAAMPRIVPSTPCARLNRPVPVVRSVVQQLHGHHQQRIGDQCEQQRAHRFDGEAGE